MRLRGRVTLAGLLAAAATCGWLGLAPEPPGEAQPAVTPPPVSAGPPGAPPQLFEWRPFTRERLAAAGREEGRLVEEVWPPPTTRAFQVQYTLDAELMDAVFTLLRRSRVGLGHVVVLDPSSGDLLAYATTDAERFPPNASYPAASLIKVVTAAAALDRRPGQEQRPCRYVGSPWRLTRRRIDPPKGGREVSMRRALATSNNQCFAQLAVHEIGSPALLDAIARFGWLESAGPGHEPGRAENPGDDSWALARLGCGLAGCRITPLHAARLAATLADGRQLEPRWVRRVTDASGRQLALPRSPEPRQVLTPALARTLREMMVDTTVRGTARKAFRTRRGPLLQGIRVAGKTGSLSGRNPDGRYEWFVGVAPAEAPRVAVAVLVVHGDLWWVTPSQLAAEVFKRLFCPKGVCRESAVERWLPGSRPSTAPEMARAAGG